VDHSVNALLLLILYLLFPALCIAIGLFMAVVLIRSMEEE